MADDQSKPTNPAQKPPEPAAPPPPPASEAALAKSAIEMEEERLLKAAQAKIAEAGQEMPTNRLEQELGSIIPQVAQAPFGAEVGSAHDYTVLPAMPSGGPPADAPRWRIELHGLKHGEGPLGLDIVGDVVVGRGASGELGPDLDLEPYGAFQRGVSRRHAMLRPTRNALYIIDLSSTNGTQHNALRLGSGVTRALRHNDNLTLGQLSFTVKIVEEPGAEKPPEEKEAVKASQPVADQAADKDKTGPLNRKVVDKDTTPTPGTPSPIMVEPPTETTLPMKSVMPGGPKLPEPMARLLEVPERPGQPPTKPTEPSEPTPTVKLPAVPSDEPTVGEQTGAKSEAEVAAEHKPGGAETAPPGVPPTTPPGEKPMAEATSAPAGGSPPADKSTPVARDSSAAGKDTPAAPASPSPTPPADAPPDKITRKIKR